MKTTLFIATYFNNAHFIEHQVNSFKTFVKDDYDFSVIDDSTDSVKSLLTENLSRNDIISECQKYGVGYIPVPQTVHALIENGGLIVKDAPHIDPHHPTERHQACLRWIFNNYKQLGFDQYKYLVLLDADMFFRKPISISEYMEGYDMAGSHREQTVNLSSLDADRLSRIPDEIRRMDGQKLDFFTLCLLFINMQTVKNLETIDNRSFRIITDTGGRTKKFIDDNPQYKFLFLKDWNSAEYRVDFFSKEGPRAPDGTENSPELIHYRGGSNWDYQSRDYYSEKLYRLFKKYIPEIEISYKYKADHDVISKSKEHIFSKE
jgi:hypothetical protein